MPLNYEISYNITLHPPNEYDPLDIRVFLSGKVDVKGILGSIGGCRIILYQFKYLKDILGPTLYIN